MATTLPPKRKEQVSEAEIEAFINKGGSPKTKKIDVDEDEIKHVAVRLTQGIINKINEERNKLPRKPGSPKAAISLRDWILEATLEKLERLKMKHK